MANERLRSQILDAGMSIDDVATHVEVDPKTVERWITRERVPHRRHRWATAKLLSSDEAYLWPAVEDDRTTTASRAEFVQIYPHRGAVPGRLWTTLLDQACEAIDVLVYAGLFLFDTHADLAEAIQDKGTSGCKVRLLVGDPDSRAVADRGDEEGIGQELAARVRMTRRVVTALRNTPGVEVRQHGAVLYSSLYRFDSELLGNMHVFGGQAPQNPVIHLRRVPGGRMFDHFMRGFDQVWNTAVPLPSK
jgi:hypothetical protein